MANAKVSLTINGRAVSAEVDTRTLLVHFIREQVKLTGTHVGCDTTQCGACTVHVNGTRVKSCTIFACQLDGEQITTIEGLAKGKQLHPMQEAFREHHGLQCGYCTPGMVMSAVSIAERYKGKALTEDLVRHELEGNLCRCTGYHNIVKAVIAGAKAMNAS
ncbi:MAG: (2Fe-2S)-binding protein [Alphaproteobacteria bacterium]|nr:(2Fe-2S)-binding protein [Alphaproteobacteria bacterium]